MTAMTIVAAREPLEPLFASSKHLWLRVWGATQAIALIVACYVTLGAAGGVRTFVESPSAARAVAIVAALIAYHAIGMVGHDWMMRRPWALALFVPIGWALVLASLAIHSAFSVLILGAILQGFIFLPFTWAITTLALLVIFTIALVLAQFARSPAPEANLIVARVVTLLAMGITFGTVMLYIHRANRDSAIRSRLLRQLDEAQRDLAARSREAGTQEERQRLARDIHDTLAQGFASVIKHLEAIELSFDAPHLDAEAVMHAARTHLTHAQDVSRESLDEIRRLVWALRPPQLLESTLAAAIKRIVTQWGDANGVVATCGIVELPPLLPDAEVIFLRATQESLSNVARHAGATGVSVSMHCVDGLVLLSIEDDGCGFAESEAASSGGSGIAGMRERVRPFGGRVMIESAVAAGTSITVALPLATIAAPST